MKKLLFTTFLFFLLVLPFFRIYAAEPIKILIVPGHDDGSPGAQYGNTREADMTLALATKIYDLLKKDERFDVYITRNQNGYTKEFLRYFENHRGDIISFKEEAKAAARAIKNLFVPKVSVPHHGVTQEVSVHLYGFNKWADENAMDAVVHVHFDDYVRDNKWQKGEYTGFTVYYPTAALSNFKESANLAADIYTELHKKYSTSTFPEEKGGLVPDQKLIALGANNTLNTDVRAVLIEYGYIYEKKFRTKSARETAYKNMANLTVAGIQNYFFLK